MNKFDYNIMDVFGKDISLNILNELQNSIFCKKSIIQPMDTTYLDVEMYEVFEKDKVVSYYLCFPEKRGFIKGVLSKNIATLFSIVKGEIVIVPMNKQTIKIYFLYKSNLFKKEEGKLIDFNLLYKTVTFCCYKDSDGLIYIVYKSDVEVFLCFGDALLFNEELNVLYYD